MKLIYGEHSSGKSSKCLELIKDKSKVFYFSLDQDKSVSRIVENRDNCNISTPKNCFLIDLEFEILVEGKPIYDTIVVDGLNFIKSYQSNFNLSKIAKGLEYLHHIYHIDVIATYNVLRNMDKMRENVINTFNKSSGWELLETKKKNKYPKVCYE